MAIVMLVVLIDRHKRLEVMQSEEKRAIEGFAQKLKFATQFGLNRGEVLGINPAHLVRTNHCVDGKCRTSANTSGCKGAGVPQTQHLCLQRLKQRLTEPAVHDAPLLLFELQQQAFQESILRYGYNLRNMADLQRFAYFARFITQRFPRGRVYDVAGGKGMLNIELSKLGYQVTTFDQRHKHLDVPYEQRTFTLAEPCTADLVVGMHPDGATRLIVEYAAQHRIPFAIVPCCSDNSMSYKQWMRHIHELAVSLGFASVAEGELPMRGRSRVLHGQFSPPPEPRGDTV